MQGIKIGTVNSAMEEAIPLLSEVSADNDDAEIRVAIMQFSSGFSWITGDDGPKELEGLSWNDLTAGGLTDFGSALEELDKKLSREGFLKTQTGAYAPAILLLSDGAPTDDWESALKKLQGNNWFKHAIKIAIDINDSSDREVLTKFTGNEKAIYKNKKGKDLLKILEVIIHICCDPISGRSLDYDDWLDLIRYEVNNDAFNVDKDGWNNW